MLEGETTFGASIRERRSKIAGDCCGAQDTFCHRTVIRPAGVAEGQQIT